MIKYEILSIKGGLRVIRLTALMLLLVFLTVLGSDRAYSRPGDVSSPAKLKAQAASSVLLALGTQKQGCFDLAVKSLEKIDPGSALQILEPYSFGKEGDEYDQMIRWGAYYLMANASLKPSKSYLEERLKNEPDGFVKVDIYLALWKLYNEPLPPKLAKAVKRGDIHYKD